MQSESQFAPLLKAIRFGELSAGFLFAFAFELTVALVFEFVTDTAFPAFALFAAEFVVLLAAGFWLQPTEKTAIAAITNKFFDIIFLSRMNLHLSKREFLKSRIKILSKTFKKVTFLFFAAKFRCGFVVK